MTDPILLWADVPLPLRMRVVDATTEMGALNVWIRAQDTARLCRAAVRPTHVSRDCYLQCGQDAAAGSTLCLRHQARSAGQAWPPNPPHRPARTPWDELDRRRPLVEQLAVPQLNSSDYLEAELVRALQQVVEALAKFASDSGERQPLTHERPPASASGGRPGDPEPPIHPRRNDEGLMNRQPTDSTPTKQIRRSGPAEDCDHCGSPSRPPDVLRTGATTERVLHPQCAIDDAVGTIIDASSARQLARDQQRHRGHLEVIA